jgi:hypothetical protein
MFKISHPYAVKGFFNYITGGQSGPIPTVAPSSLNHLAPPPPPIKVLFSKIEKWNLDGRSFDVLVTEICFVNLISCLLSSNDCRFKNAKHGVKFVNTLDFKNFQVEAVKHLFQTL